MICVGRDEKNLADVERLVEREIPRLANPLGGAKSEEAAQPADEAAATEKPKRTRSRSRKKDTAPKDEAADVTADVSEPKADAPKVAAEPEKKSEAEQPKSEGRTRGGRGGRGGKGRKNDNRGGGNRVVGLGDHLPDFIGLSFEERDH